jgi:hypothetical protein
VIRFAPGRGGQPAATFWRVWAEGNEVYASSRTPGGSPKISVHASGKIHYRLEAKLKKDLADAMPFAGERWLHAVELRFLLSPGALPPLGEREGLENKAAYLIPVADGFFLCANLIIGAAGASADTSLPAELVPGGQTLWRARLRDGRLAVLVARMLALDEQNMRAIRYIRNELKPNFSVPDAQHLGRVEILHLHWSPTGGNVVLVVPMGEEAFRLETDYSSFSDIPRRYFHYSSGAATLDLAAPDGRIVASFELGAIDKRIELVKGTPKLEGIGLLTMRIHPENLVTGNKFIGLPLMTSFTPTIGDVMLSNRQHVIHSHFDGVGLTTELRATSGSLRNKNLEKPIAELRDDEELLFASPPTNLKLSATLDKPVASAELTGRFVLRDHR